jgi:HPt (histidine-containing phosphotransfer) domain-containing protein
MHIPSSLPAHNKPAVEDINTDDKPVAQESVDIIKLFEKFGRSKKVLETCLGLFYDEVPALLSTIEGAVNCRNAAEMQVACHNLRASLVIMEMTVAAAIATEIEKLSSENNFNEIDIFLPALKKEVANATGCINKMLQML